MKMGEPERPICSRSFHGFHQRSSDVYESSRMGSYKNVYSLKDRRYGGSLA